jgi:putative glutathione S-transferase
MEKTALAEVERGRFTRTASVYRGVPTPEELSEPNRFVLYISLACPWANRCLAALFLLKLEDKLPVSVVHPVWQRTRPDDDTDKHCGWVFRRENDEPVSTVDGHGSFDCSGCVPDPLGLARAVRDLYAESDAKFTVPVLYDAKTKSIVNNESSDILRILNSWAAEGPTDLYPESDRAEIDRMNEFIYESINNGVYKCGFATTQEAYDEAVAVLFGALDECDMILSKRRWIANTRDISESDIRLFMTLIRFDAVYVVYFKTNLRMLKEYQHLREYVLDILATYPEVARSVNMRHIKTHYFCSHAKLNPYGIVPRGPEAWWDDVVFPSKRSLTMGSAT